jgi:hypothetical protein
MNTEINAELILTNKLREELQSLKVQYLEKVAEWSLVDYKKCQDLKKEYFSADRNYISTNKNRYYELQKMYHGKISYILSMRIETYTAKQLKKAELHFECSINKLALRILKKGIDVSKLTMKTGHVGLNIETVLTDGIKSVKAWTIIAEGEIQCPHYRYLVK